MSQAKKKENIRDAAVQDERSPCSAVCKMDPGGLCLGCMRSLPEIASWGSVDAKTREAMGREARARRDWFEPDGRVRALMALGPRGAAGLRGALPWRLSSELAWFKQASSGLVLALGRTSWEALGRDLPGRPLLAVGSVEPSGLSVRTGSHWVPDLARGKEVAFNMSKSLCVAGGPRLWASCWDQVELAWITRVEPPNGCLIEADSYFEPDLKGWVMAAQGPSSGADGSWCWRTELWERQR